MPYALGSYSASETAAFNADNPLVIGHNALRDVVDARWTAAGTQTDTDITSTVHYAYRAYDGRAVSPTRADAPGSSTIYFNVQISPSSIDTCALLFLRSFPDTTVTIQIADDAAFTTNVVDFLGPVAASTGLPRLARSFEGSRYDDVEFIRVRFVKASGTYNAATIPMISEFFIGTGRILGLGWDYGSDMDPVSVEASEYEARSGDTTRYVMHRGRYKVRHSQILSGENFHGLDDVATVRLIASESLGYTRPVLYIPRPSSAVDRAMLGHLPDGGIDLPQDNFDAAIHRFDFEELPLFRDLEG
jgi:hypothetical protein